jgi:hypothetical protein
MLSCGVLLVAACAAPAAPGSPGGASSPVPGSATPPTGAGQGSPPPVVDAATAAAAVLGAQDDAARRTAVLSVLRGVGIGVYTPDGDPVIAGAERADDDVWIYDFQADALAASVRDGDAIWLQDVAADLVELAASSGGETLDAADMVLAVSEAAAEVAADPSDPEGYALAVAMELARNGPFRTDLTAPPTEEPVILDGLSAFLVTVDLVLPAVAARPPDSAVLGLRLADAGAAAPPMTAAERCLREGMGGHPSGWIAGVAARRVKGLTGIPNASFNRYLQAQLTNALVDAKLDGPASWHHRHQEPGGDVTGHPEDYYFSLRLRVQTPPAPIRCGPLAGETIAPREGDIVGASVRWIHPRLEAHGQITVEDTITDASGGAYLVVNPRVEPHPSGIGPEVKERLTVMAQANVLQALGGDLYSKLGGVPALQRRHLFVDVAWHRSYVVTVDLTSKLNITKGGNYTGLLGTATATGTLTATDFRAASTARPPTAGAIVNPGTLEVSAETGPNAGACNTEWIVEKAGASRTIDWQVWDLALWPPEQLSVRLESGPANEQPDYYRGKICQPGGVSFEFDPSPMSVWESYIYQGHRSGLQFSGTGPNGWEVIADDTTWEKGGQVAHWHSQETCAGRCDGWLDMVVFVEPLPDP